MTPQQRIPIALLLFGAAPLAQSLPGFGPLAASPPSSGTSVHGRVEGCRFTADEMADVVYLEDGNLMLAMGVEAWTAEHTLWDATQPLATAATAFAVVPGASAAGLDVIAYSTSTGAYWIAFDPVQGDLATPELLASGVTNARRFRADDLDGDGQVDLMTLSSDGKTMHRFDDVASVPTPTTRTLTRAVTDFVITDYDGTGERDVICVRNHSLDLAPDSGVLIQKANFVGVPSGLTTVEDSSVATGRVAFVATHAGVDTLYVADASLTSPESLTLPTGDAVHLASGDLDEDGEDDLIVSDSSTHEVLLLYNRSGSATPTFDTGVSWSSWVALVSDDPGTPQDEVTAAQPSGALGGMHAYDLNHDGDLELVAAVDSLGQLVYLGSTDVVDERVRKPVYAGAFIVEYPSSSLHYYFADFTAPSALATNWTHVEVTVRHRPDFDTNPEADGDLYRLQTFPLEVGGGVQIYISHEGGELDDDDYPYCVRYVELVGGAIVSAGPALALSFAPADEVADLVAGATSNSVLRFTAQAAGSEWTLIPVLEVIGGRVGSGDTPVDPPTCVEDPLPVTGGDDSDPPPTP